MSTTRGVLPLLLLAVAVAPGAATAQVPDRVGGATQAFVAGLYDAYARTPGPDYLGKDASAAFAPSLVAVIRLVQQRNAGYVGPGLEADPICDCQDPDGVQVAALRMGGGDTRRASASVALRWPSGETRQVKLDLVATPDGWRVADVHSMRTPSFQAALTGRR